MVSQNFVLKSYLYQKSSRKNLWEGGGDALDHEELSIILLFCNELLPNMVMSLGELAKFGASASFRTKVMTS